MWKRFMRALRALFGGAISAIEDPRLILEENIRELNDQLPKMNQNLATIKANQTLLEKDQARYQAEFNDLVAKMKAAINAGRDDIAANYAMRLETVKRALSDTQTQLESAKVAYEKATEVMKAFRRERERKINEAKEAIRAYDRSKTQAKIADALEQFEVGGISQTHDEMVQRINEKTATNEARVDIALQSVDTTSIKYEEEAEKLRAMEMVKQFKMEMGMIDTPAPQNTQAKESQNDIQKTGQSGVL